MMSRVKLIPDRSELPVLVRRPGAFARQYWTFLAVLVVGATLDALTTLEVIRILGATAEIHPVQRIMMHVFGPLVGVPLAKLTQVAFVIFVAAWWRPWCRWILLACGVLYCAAAASNHFRLL